jgi:hypothetical protein
MKRPQHIKTTEQLAQLPELSFSMEKIPLPDDRFPDATGEYLLIPHAPHVLCNFVEPDDILLGEVDGELWRPVLTPEGWKRERAF